MTIKSLNYPRQKPQEFSADLSPHAIQYKQAPLKGCTPAFESVISPLTRQPAPNRLPCGTRKVSLNAARFPAWHGSRIYVAQDRLFIAAYREL